MIHQMVAIPCAGGLSGASAFCFEPQPAARSANGSSVTRRARGNLSPDGFTVGNGLPAPSRVKRIVIR